MRSRILIIEDHQSVRMILRDMLACEGYAVLAAPDGVTGLALARRAAPGLILLDLQMSMTNSIAFLRAYRQTPRPHAAIVVTSADPAGHDTLRHLNVDAFVSKPFDLDEVLSIVGKQLRAHALVS